MTKKCELDIIIHAISLKCDCGGTGRRARLRGVWATVPVQVRSVAPKPCPLGRGFSYADVAELADALDSGSSGRKAVQVQVLSSAPNQYNPNLFPIGDGFGFIVFFDRYETTHFRNGLERKPTSKPRGPRKKKQTP